MKPSTDDGALSVDIRRLLEDPSVPTSVLGGETTYGLAELVAKVPRDIGLQVEHSPLPDNEAHADIRGFYEMTKAAAKRARTTLADKAVWIQMPAGALDPP